MPLVTPIRVATIKNKQINKQKINVGGDMEKL